MVKRLSGNVLENRNTLGIISNYYVVLDTAREVFGLYVAEL